VTVPGAAFFAAALVFVFTLILAMRWFAATARNAPPAN
jgi:hypothetical protein